MKEVNKKTADSRRRHYQVKLLNWFHYAPAYSHNGIRAELTRIFSEYCPVTHSPFIEDRIKKFISDMVDRRSSKHVG